jgi:hypothetical protein
MPTSGRLYQALKESCMRKMCAKAVESWWEACGCEYILCTASRSQTMQGRVKAAISARFLSSLYTVFPQAFSGSQPLFLAHLSPFSTPPITTTTTYIN